MTQAGKIRFLRLVTEELSREKVRDGIGLLAEKRMHGLFKRWVIDDPACHEVKIKGAGERPRRFVADILMPGGEIVEVQTGKLYPMREKLAFYMEETDHLITVLHPIIATKYISWIDKESGEVTSRAKSPLHQTPLHAVAELKPYLSYLGSERFTLCLPVIEAEEFRLLDGWARGGKRGSHRFELMPTALLNTVVLRTRADYAALFPKEAALDAPFTAKAFGKLTHLRGYDLYDALAVFEGLGVIERCGMKNRAVLYERTQLNSGDRYEK